MALYLHSYSGQYRYIDDLLALPASSFTCDLYLGGCGIKSSFVTQISASDIRAYVRVSELDSTIPTHVAVRSTTCCRRRNNHT